MVVMSLVHAFVASAAAAQALLATAWLRKSLTVTSAY